MCFAKSVSEFAGELRVREARGRPREASVKGCVQHLLQVPGSHKVQVGSNVSWELLQVLLIAFGEDDTFHPCPMSGQDLVLDPANLRQERGVLKVDSRIYGTSYWLVWRLTGSTRPLSVISPVMATSDLTNRPLNREARQVTMVTPADGPSFVTAPAGKWR